VPWGNHTELLEIRKRPPGRVESVIIGRPGSGLDEKSKSSYRTHRLGRYAILPRQKDVKEKVHGREKTSLYGDRARPFDEQRLLPHVGKLVQSGAALPVGAVLSFRVRSAAATAAAMLSGAELFLAGASCGAGTPRAGGKLELTATVSPGTPARALRSASRAA
jgi:hypothetical protein